MRESFKISKFQNFMQWEYGTFKLGDYDIVTWLHDIVRVALGSHHSRPQSSTVFFKLRLV